MTQQRTHNVYDARWCGTHGIGRFASELRERLHNFSDVALKSSPLSPADPLQLSRELKRRKARLFFSPGFNVPLAPPCPVVPTIHDLIHIHFKEERSFAKTIYYKLIQRPVVRNSPLVFTVSEFSKGQICDWYSLSPERVVVVGNGISEEFKPEGPAIRGDLPYFLCVGNSKPHKNLDTLLSAFASVRRSYACNLVLVTKSTPQLQQLITDANIGDSVKFVSGVSDADLAAYYRGCLCLVFPSRYEGFGFPALEAMGCGCPVLSSNATSLPEVGGDAVLYFNPDSSSEIAELIYAALRGDLDLADLKGRGIERARQFTWKNVATCVTNALADIVD